MPVTVISLFFTQLKDGQSSGAGRQLPEGSVKDDLLHRGLFFAVQKIAFLRPENTSTYDAEKYNRNILMGYSTN